VLPATQTVPPVHRCPPHCPHFGTVTTGTLGVGVAAAVELATAVLVATAVLGFALVTSVVPTGSVMTLPPGPATEVVMEPDSTYTPLK